MNGLFYKEAAKPGHPEWKKLTERYSELYERKDEIRSPFERDYTRILHSNAYRRLKHKTQVFYNIDNDHICTRMEHAAHVGSVSESIAQRLGLNTDLTRAIALGHDLGHAPFGHHGERVLDGLSKKYLKKPFWHEKNGLRFVDEVELLEDTQNHFCNLGLTYAVRDGIISHCGEINQNAIKPRRDIFDLACYEFPAQFQPATWEGCVVKISDKIAYVGRDIEDAISLGFLSDKEQDELRSFVSMGGEKVLNTTVIIYNLIMDICENSSPEKGITLSRDMEKRLSEIKDFNVEKIYQNKHFRAYNEYSALVITQIFETLYSYYDDINTFKNLSKDGRFYPELTKGFKEWLFRYVEGDCVTEQFDRELYSNKKIYGRMENREVYVQSIIDYISGMTDRYAVKIFNEMLTY